MYRKEIIQEQEAQFKEIKYEKKKPKEKYYCGKCRCWHNENSKIGNKHLPYKGITFKPKTRIGYGTSEV